MTTGKLSPVSNWHRRKFIRSLALAAGATLGLEALAACGDTNPTTAPASATTTAAATTTTSATTPASMTTVSATSAVAATTTAAKTTAAASGDTDDDDDKAAQSGPPTPPPLAGSPADAAAGSAVAGYTNFGPTDKYKAASAPTFITLDNKQGYIYFKNEFYIYSNLCTHKGCPISYDSKDQEFECHCHGSQYALTGTVKHGPAKDRLPLYEYKIVNNNLYIRAV